MGRRASSIVPVFCHLLGLQKAPQSMERALKLVLMPNKTYEEFQVQKLKYKFTSIVVSSQEEMISESLRAYKYA